MPLVVEYVAIGYLAALFIGWMVVWLKHVLYWRRRARLCPRCGAHAMRCLGSLTFVRTHGGKYVPEQTYYHCAKCFARLKHDRIRFCDAPADEWAQMIDELAIE
jgi:hypothetical protein